MINICGSLEESNILMHFTGLQMIYQKVEIATLRDQQVNIE